MALDLEKALLIGRWPQSVPKDTSDAVALCNTVVLGNVRDALTSRQARKVFKTTSCDVLTVSLNDLLDIPRDRVAEDDGPDELVRLSLAVACLHTFVQANWTGPDIAVSPLQVISFQSCPLTEDELNRKAISELAHGGEPAYHLAQHATFLRLAQILLSPPYEHCHSVEWWRLRAMALHQRILDEPVAIPDVIFSSLTTLDDLIHDDAALASRLSLERGLLEHYVGHNKLAADYFVRAAKSSGLKYELTGALGKRTKFQDKDVSQLVILAQSRLSEGDENCDASSPDIKGFLESTHTGHIPETIALNDDTLLENTEFKKSAISEQDDPLSYIDPSSQPALHPLDQCILLALCLNVKNTSPSHGLTSEQMYPYISRVISHPENWSVHTMALLLRSRLQSSRTRTVERATLQLQALVDQMPTADSTLPERLRYFHSILLPSKWEMERELAQRFMSLGVVKSALEIFERLEMWEDVVKCWQSMENKEKAIAIVRDLLEGRKQESGTVIAKGKALFKVRQKSLDATREAKLWCMLGDLEPESALEYYTRAWALSGETSGRAMRSLGGYYFSRGDYPNAITSLSHAVAINPLLSRSWFILGCAYIRVENWEGAREAFSRCVAIDEEDGESWNNLASVYLRMSGSNMRSVDAENGIHSLMNRDQITEAIPFENKLLAFRALKQGLKYSYDNWRMWSNYMVVAIDVGELSEACMALGRVVEETSTKLGARSADEDVLERLVGAVTKTAATPTDESGEKTAVNSTESRRLLPRVSDLFERTILPRVSSPRIFRSYARLMAFQSRWSDALKAHLDGYRCSIAGTVSKGETDLMTWQQAVPEVEEIVDVLRNFGPHVEGYRWSLQAKSIVRSFLAKTKEFEGEPEWIALTKLSEDLRNEG